MFYFLLYFCWYSYILIFDINYFFKFAAWFVLDIALTIFALSARSPKDFFTTARHYSSCPLLFYMFLCLFIFVGTPVPFLFVILHALLYVVFILHIFLILFIFFFWQIRKKVINVRIMWLFAYFGYKIGWKEMPQLAMPHKAFAAVATNYCCCSCCSCCASTWNAAVAAKTLELLMLSVLSLTPLALERIAEALAGRSLDDWLVQWSLIYLLLHTYTQHTGT